MFAELARNPNSVFDRICIGTAVAHDGDSLDSKQWCTAVFRVIEAASESVERVLGEDVSNLSRKSLLKFLAEHTAERFDETFAKLEAHITGEAVADNHINFTFENVSSF